MANSLLCSVAGCGKSRHAHGMCSTHYSRLTRRGTLAEPTVPTVKEACEALYIPEPNSGCWIWIGNRLTEARGGYACFTCRPHGIINQRAHRHSWKMHRHDITEDVHVLHRCDNPLCVNPNHLFLGDQKVNMADKVHKGRQNKGDEHGMHKLVEADAIAIRSDKRLYAEIAAEFGVTVTTVSDIKRGRSWRHLGPLAGRYNLAA